MPDDPKAHDPQLRTDKLRRTIASIQDRAARLLKKVEVVHQRADSVHKAADASHKRASAMRRKAQQSRGKRAA